MNVHGLQAVGVIRDVRVSQSLQQAVAGHAGDFMYN